MYMTVESLNSRLPGEGVYRLITPNTMYYFNKYHDKSNFSSLNYPPANYGMESYLIGIDVVSQPVVG